MLSLRLTSKQILEVTMRQKIEEALKKCVGWRPMYACMNTKEILPALIKPPILTNSETPEYNTPNRHPKIENSSPVKNEVHENDFPPRASSPLDIKPDIKPIGQDVKPLHLYPDLSTLNNTGNVARIKIPIPFGDFEMPLGSPFPPMLTDDLLDNYTNEYYTRLLNDYRLDATPTRILSKQSLFIKMKSVSFNYFVSVSLSFFPFLI